MRRCKVCHEEKPLEEFTPLRKDGREYRSYRCKLCRADHAYRTDVARLDRRRNRAFSQLMSKWKKTCLT